MNKDQAGQMIVLAIVVVGLVLVNTLVIVTGSQIFSQNSHYSLQAEQATSLAEAGVDKAIASLNATGGSYTGDAEVFLGPGSFSVTITTPNASTKVIEATGYVPSKANPKARRTVKITSSKGIGAAFNYGVQSGEGGLEMLQNSTVNGSVYSNGNILMANNARILGDAFVAGGTAPSPDQSADCADPSCSDFIFGKNVSGENRLDVAQSFRPETSGVLNKISLKIKKTGTPPDITIRLLKDDGGRPDKNGVLATGTLSASLVTSQFGFVDVAFISPPLLGTDETYWILADTSSDSSNYWSWSADTLQGYTRGAAVWTANWQAGNATWTVTSSDLGFQTYMGGVATSIMGSNGATISGDARANTLEGLTITGGAYYQAAEDIAAGSYHPGSSDPAVKVLPISEGNITFWKGLAQGQAVYTGDISSCRAQLGPGKYVGNITFSNNCTVTIIDPVWVTGNLILDNGVTLQLDPSYGSSSGILIADGTISLSNNNKLKGSGTSGSYLVALSTYDSVNLGGNAINISQGGNQGVLYAGKGIVEIQNTNYLSEVTAWKIILSNGVTINYESGLASTLFSSGPSGSFSLVKGTYQLK